VWPFVVVLGEPGTEVGLQRLHRLVQGVAHFDVEELVEHGAVEAFDEAVGARGAARGQPSPSSSPWSATSAMIVGTAGW